MKFTITALVLAVLVAVAFAGLAPIPKDKQRCNYICHKSDASVCGSNGICLDRFSSRCEMQIYNCLNPHIQFQEVQDHKCNESFQPICTRSDFH